MRVNLTVAALCALIAIATNVVPVHDMRELSLEEAARIKGGAGPCKYVSPEGCPIRNGCPDGGCARVAIAGGGSQIQCVGGGWPNAPRTVNPGGGVPIFDHCTGAAYGYTNCEADGTTVQCTEERKCKLTPCDIVAGKYVCRDDGPFPQPHSFDLIMDNMVMSGEPCGVG